MIRLAAEGPWTLGWNFLVAVGTLGLAGVTGWLAWTTRRLAGSTRDEVASEWRPVLLANGEQMTVRGHDDRPATLFVSFQNVGRGPALDVVVAASPSANDTDRARRGVVREGEDYDVQLNVPNGEDRITVLVDYVDLARRRYSTAAALWVIPPAEGTAGLRFNARLDRVRIYADRHLTRSIRDSFRRQPPYDDSDSASISWPIMRLLTIVNTRLPGLATRLLHRLEDRRDNR